MSLLRSEIQGGRAGYKHVAPPEQSLNTIFGYHYRREYAC